MLSIGLAAEQETSRFMLKKLSQRFQRMFKREHRNLCDLSDFAKSNRRFLAAVRSVYPECSVSDAGQVLLKEINRFVAERDYNLLTSLLDALRPFLNPDQSSDAIGYWAALTAESRLLTKDRLQRGEINALWGVTPIINLGACVAADRLLGVNARSLVFTTYYISSDFDFVFSEIEARIRSERGQDLILFRWLMLSWAVVNFDFFHLYNDRGIIEPAGGYGSSRFGIAVNEMEIYRRAGKRLYTYAYGADHRTRQKTLALGKWNFCLECPDPGVFCVCDDTGGAKMLAEIKKYSTAVIAHGLAMKLIPGARNVPYLAVDLNKFAARHHSSDVSRKKLIVGHFPNHGHFKGSKYLQAAIHALKQEGHAIELLQLGGRPNSEILEAMQEVDVLVDQLMSGAFGLTAVEAMAFGCPVICYLHDDVAVANREVCPIIEASPETIKDVLRGLISDRTRLSRIGAAGRDYVRRNYSVEALSKHLANLYESTAELPEPLKTKMAQTGASELD